MPIKKTLKTSKKKKVAKKTTRKKSVKKNVKKKTVKKAVKKAVKKVAKKTTKKKLACRKKCKPAQAFWVNNGPVFHSVKELISLLKTEITDEQFLYHTKRDGNDFAKWIEDCLHDRDCAIKLKRVRSKDGAIRVLSKCKCH